MVNFNIIDGNDDYINQADEFAELYNNHDISVREVQEKMNLNQNQYKKLLKYCKENDMVRLRYKYNKWIERKKKQYNKVDNYHRVNDKGHTYFIVSKCRNCKKRYYASFKKEEQAQRMVELLKECDWDHSRRHELKEKVLSEVDV